MSPDDLRLPLHFRPVYQEIPWGGRRMAVWREGLPPGRIGESWDLAQQPRGMSVVDDGPLAGRTLAELVSAYGKHLVGDCHDGGDFPLLIKLIDATDRLSVQVHPDDDLARRYAVGQRGKTECWFMVGNGGELFQGTRPGVDRKRFEQAIAAGTVNAMEGVLNRFPTRDGDFFFIGARTVHALGGGCLLWEIQQSCDCTFRVSDWGRLFDGKPRPLHVRESLDTIDFADRPFGPVRAGFDECPGGGAVRRLVSCPYFGVEERRAQHTEGGGNGLCTVVICLDGYGRLATSWGHLDLMPMSCYLVPAAAGGWSATADEDDQLRLLLAQPH